VYDQWRQTIWDAGDTVLITDPSTDPDVGARFARLPAAAYLPTWHARRVGGVLGTREQEAAIKSAMYAATPTVALFDSLGRTFATIAHNRYRDPDAPAGAAPVEQLARTRVALDVSGNVRAMTDQLGRVVARYDHDLLGARLHQATMDAGEGWLLVDVGGATIHLWDARGHHVRTEYDRLRRAGVHPAGRGRRAGGRRPHRLRRGGAERRGIEPARPRRTGLRPSGGRRERAVRLRGEPARHAAARGE
jgi:hypothetical protein